MRDPRQEPGFKGKRLDERAYQIQCAILDALLVLIQQKDNAALISAPVASAAPVATRATRKADSK